jgi:hypothetical protein
VAGGLMTQFSTANDDSIAQFGIVLQANALSQFSGGYLLDESESDAVTYPVSVVAGSSSIEYVYVASLGSTDASETGDSVRIDNEHFPDLTSGGYRRYGNRYHLRVTKLKTLGGLDAGAEMTRETMESEFDKSFATDDGSSVYTTGMAFVGGQLVVVGSTRGSGNVFGQGVGSDMDGFVVVLNPGTGGLSIGSTRIAFLPDEDDWVLNICTDPNDSNVFYIVGATTGSDVGTSHAGTIHPFVARMTLSPFGEPEWYKQLEVKPSWGSSKPTDAQVYGCAVDGESSTVYVAGVVKGGASMVFSADDPQISAGKNDLFVANLESASGEVRWVKQLGTSKDERMGHGGGIVVDSSGNAILLGQTEGFMYRTPTDEGRKLHEACTADKDRKLHKASGVNEVVIFSVDIDGTFKTPVVETDGPGPNASEGDDKSTGNPPEIAIPEIQAVLVEAALTSSWDKFMVAMFVIGPLVLLICFCVVCRAFSRKHNQKDNQRKTLAIFKYLRAFDVDDVDIRRSPAGGYHGTYLNELAVGSNKSDRNIAPERSESDASRPGLTEGSIDDYLFMSKKKVDSEDGEDTSLSRRV